MRKHDGCISGPHHFWIQFWCGLVFGGVLGPWWSWQLFERTVFIMVGTAVTALIIAFSCGRWGDSAWHWIIQKLRGWV